jgi:hypothetical protein
VAEDPFAILPELIEQGKKFTFDNFAQKNARGFPRAYSPEWLVWTHQVNQVVAKIGQSTIASSIARGLGIELLGNGTATFESAQGLIVSGLEAADKVFGSGVRVPASDRVVTLGHNSPAQTEALKKIDSLVEAVKKANDFPGSEDDREEAIAELSAARKLFEAAKVRVVAVTAVLQPRLRWLIDKAGGALVGIMAKGLWDYLIGLHIF